MGDEDVENGKIISAPLNERLTMMCRDVAIYGKLLASQRRTDLASTGPGFMEKLRKKKS
jgi:hypothetical protein